MAEENAQNIPRHFAEELVSEIIHRIPARSVGQFNAVNRMWRRLISRPEFVRRHVQEMIEQNKVFFIFRSGEIFQPVFFDVSTDKLTLNGRVVDDEDDEVEVLAAYDGLLCLCDIDDNYYLWNPTTHRIDHLPTSKIEFPQGTSAGYAFFGLGYDASTRDYKLVRITIFNSDSFQTEVKVYSKSRGSWNRVTDFPYDFPLASPGVFCAGSLHWRTGSRHSNSIAKYNLTDGSYGLLSIPESIRGMEFLQLWALDDEILAVYSFLEGEGIPFRMCILRDYNDEESWYTVEIPRGYEITNGFPYNSLQPLCFEKPGHRKIYFRVDPRGTFGMYDMEEKLYYPIDQIQRLPNSNCTMFRYVESLDTPNIWPTF